MSASTRSRLTLALLAATFAFAQEPDFPKITTQPVVVSKTEPKYTADARAAGIEGDVSLEISIDEKGMPFRITILKHLKGLDEQAIVAAQQWRFKPGISYGTPAPSKMKVLMSFRLSDPLQ
jgi:protein TonB